MNVIIDQQGNLRTIYNEALDLSACGEVTITRASNVEWSPGIGWHAYMGEPFNMDGPVLGPFAKRSEALAAEVAFIEENVL